MSSVSRLVLLVSIGFSIRAKYLDKKERGSKKAVKTTVRQDAGSGSDDPVSFGGQKFQSTVIILFFYKNIVRIIG